MSKPWYRGAPLGVLYFPLFSSFCLHADDNILVSGDDIERVSVTGSRIVNSNLALSTPAITISKADIQRQGTRDLASILAALPVAYSSDTLAANAVSPARAGLSSANLRGLGTNRTLVLVNGKRHISSKAGSQQVDLSTIPVSLIKRIDILTGSASAVYGSDAVAGVINIVLDDNYSGSELSVFTSTSLKSIPANEYGFTFTRGVEVHGGKGSAVVYFSMNANQEVMLEDIPQFNQWGTIANTENETTNDGKPENLFVEGLYSDIISPFGVINPHGAIADRWSFTPSGQLVLQPDRQANGSGLYSPVAYGYFPSGCDTCFDREGYINHLPKFERINTGVLFNYELSDDILLKVDTKFVDTEAKQQAQPAFLFNRLAINVADNPYLPSVLKQTASDMGQETIVMSKFFDELGNISAENKRQTTSLRLMLDGESEFSGKDIGYELHYGYGQNHNTRKRFNDLIVGNMFAAIDSVADPVSGEIKCRNQVPLMQGENYIDPAIINPSECQPFNPFGTQSSAQARDFVTTDIKHKDKIKLQTLGASLNFNIEQWLDIEPVQIGIVAGVEYRKASSKTLTDDLTKTGLLFTTVTQDEHGKYNVLDGFVEAHIQPHSDLSIELAFLTSKYSHTGRANAWKLGSVYTVNDRLRVRGSYATSVRAPNITEAFSPTSRGLIQLKDPCHSAAVNANPNRASNCAQLGVPMDFSSDSKVIYEQSIKGNDQLAAEQSKSLTFGATWFGEQFNYSIDYYDIEIQDAISLLSAQEIANNCVDSGPKPDTQFCSKVTRNSQTHLIDQVTSTYFNAEKLVVEGIEIQAGYTNPVRIFKAKGSFNSKLIANYLIDKKLYTSSGHNNVDEVGLVNNPELQANLVTSFELSRMTVDWSVKYKERVRTTIFSESGDTAEDVYPYWLPSMVTHDLSVGYQFGSSAILKLGVNNVFDKVAPGYTYNSGYDLLGRMAFLNLSVAL